jgi:undecaprenyl-diphosphatase
MDSLFNAVILGIVEGLTEFLPVSSTGHLILVSDFLKLDHTKSDSFNIIIQFGAILAVVYLYRERFFDFFNIQKLKELTNFENCKNAKTLNLLHIFLAILPVLLIGFITRKWIKTYLFNTPVVIFSFIFVGILMIIIEKLKPKAEIVTLDQISYKDAFIIGLFQCFALIPGVSRSGTTILTSMMRKIDVKTSADFSFLISVPVISAATLYEFLKIYKDFSRSDLSLIICRIFRFFYCGHF